MGIENILESKKGFINFTYEMLLNDKIIDILPNDHIVIELLETMKIDEHIVKRCKELKAKGYLIAVDDFIGDEENYKDILNIIDIVKVDLMGIDNLDEITEKLKKYNVDLLAEKVETKEEFEECKRLGYKYFQGYFFAKPIIIEGKKIESSYHSLIKLLELLEKNAEIAEIVDVFKTESGLSYQILYVLNNTVSSLRKEVTSIRQAISLLGVTNIKKWVMLLLYMQEGEEGDSCKCNPICSMALSRAKIMENLEENRKGSNKKSIEEAFITGLLSLLDALLCIKKEDIFKEIKVSDNVKNSILTETGPYSGNLQIAKCLEKRDYEKAVSCLNTLNIESNVFDKFVF